MTSLNRIVSAAVALAASFVAIAPAAAQDQARPVARIMESYPPHIQSVIEQHRSAMLPGTLGNTIELQGVYNRSKLWQPGQTLRVCFFGGLPETRSRIARAAKRWEAAGNIKLDFGGDVTRLCNPSEMNAIRVGFGYKGYWSTLGQDSVNFVRQADQSMNLELYDVSPPAEPEFSRIVYHEFGHALGLQHEHQNPIATCGSEFNWPTIYSVLAGPPNNWSKEKVDFNMRELIKNEDLKTVGEFDRQSIMLYTFPAWMYVKGAASPCYFTVNSEISKGDRDALAVMYPADPAVAQAKRVQDVKLMREKLSSTSLSSGARERALQNLEVLYSGRSSQYKHETLQKLNAPAAQ